MDTVSIIGDDYFDEYFDEYKNLGGKKSKKEYRENLGVFLKKLMIFLLRVILNSTIQDKKLLKPL